MTKTTCGGWALAALLSATTPLSGQTGRGAEGLSGIKSKAELEKIVAGLRSGELKDAQALFDAAPQGPYRIYTSYISARKGRADIHPQDDEIFVVLSGSARCTIGGDIPDKRLEGHDYHGTSVSGGVTREVGVGDIVSAPRGTAHQMDPGSGHILYVVIKVFGRQ